jgi:N-acetylneuraminic acid mutarotase
VWVLDLKTFTWYKQNCDKNCPAPRDNAAAAYIQGCMAVFGGHAAGKRLNDLAVLDLGTFAWSTWASVIGQPSPREGAALCVGHGNLLFLHGGASNFGMDDLWVYDVKHSAWTEVCAGGRKPPIRRGHVVFVHDSQLYLFGGVDELGAPSTALFRLLVDYGANWQTARLEWEELVSDRAFNRSRCAPAALRRALACMLCNW